MDNQESPWIEVLNEDWSGPLRLKVRGRSMWPTLRPDDLVTVEPTTAQELRIGDWVLLRGPQELFLHRFLGFTRHGLLLAKGDGHRAPDFPWPPETLLGRAVAFSRQGQTIPVSPSSLRERVRTGAHRLMAASWSLLHRVGLLLLLLAAALALIPMTARASVDLVSFEAVSDGQVIRVTWETASEVDSFGFYVLRAFQEGDEYPRVSDFIEAGNDVTGRSYEYTDADVELGNTYYYRLEAVDVYFVSEIYPPIAVIHPPPATETPTPTATPTTPSPTSSTDPSPTPRQSSIRFWADPDHISQGGCAELRWQVENAREIYFQGQRVTDQEDRQACPQQTAIYILRVVTDAGEETRKVTVHVQNGSSSPPPTSTPTPRPPASTSTPTPTPPTSTSASTPTSPTPRPRIAGAALTPTPTPSPTHSHTPTPTPASGSAAPMDASPTPTPDPSPTHRPAASRNSPLPCGLLLALAGGGIGLILLGVWGFRRTRRRK